MCGVSFVIGGAPRGSLSVSRDHEGVVTVEFLGEETGVATVIGSSRLGLNVDAVIVHEAGHSYWADRFERGYARAAIRVLAIRPVAGLDDVGVDGGMIKGLHYEYTEIVDGGVYRNDTERRAATNRFAASRDI